MIRFWYDIATLSYRYIELAPTYTPNSMAVVMPDGSIQEMPRNSALETQKFSRVLLEPQDMLDALIAHGLKPSKLVGTVGHVEALEKHIAFAESVVARVLK